MKQLLQLSLFSLFLIFSCKRVENNQTNFTEIEIDLENPKELLFSQLFDTCFFVPLPSEIPLGEVQQMIIGDRIITVLDSRISKTVSTFNFKGELIAQFAENGDGPGKYLNPHGIVLSSDENEVFVHCNMSRKVIEYTLDGKLLSEHILSSVGAIDDIEISSDGFITSITDGSFVDGSKIAFYDEAFSKPIFPFGNYSRLSSEEKNVGKINFLYPEFGKDSFYFQDILSPIFVHIEKNRIDDIFRFSFSSRDLLLKHPERNASEYLFISRNEGLAYLLGNHIDGGDFMLLDIMDSGNLGLVLWDKQSNEAFKVTKLVNDLSLLMNFNSIPSSYNHTPGYLSLIIPFSMFSEIRSKVDLTLNPYESIIQGINMDDPESYILLTYRVKKDVELSID
ncbi:6-bladed beta-propeller [Algoriphagus sediminis]|uniref:6-bladed beta-propeller n=1 Tax=Algoriphagus sediminis TaxID=3057113 RepID=A0ABT7Y926_9BACT|nr:6-bladed beta-propeller [Algoriphagus sediminis]MDN3203011.1 6-bladed beta-propeller [Algoriphagus sediminis]